MSFGWSAGDILTAISFIVKTSKALHETHGAAGDFRHVILSLRSIEGVLRPLLNLCALYPEYRERIKAQVDAVTNPAGKFLESVEPLAASLGVPKTGLLRHVRTIPQKLEWYWFKSKEARALLEDIKQGGQLINILLLNINTEHMHKMSGRIPIEMQMACEAAISRTSLEPDITALTNLVIDIKKMLENMKTSLDRPVLRPEIFLTINNYNKTTANETLYHYTPAMLKANAFHLEFQDESWRLRSAPLEVHGIEANPNLIFRIEEWWNYSHSNAIWIQEAPDAETPSSLATDIVALAQTAGLPVVSCFCERQFDSQFTELTQLDLLIRLTYSLIYQLVGTFEVEFASNLAFQTERFSRLDRDPSTIPMALKLIQDLIAVKSGRLLIVLDGMQLFDGFNGQSGEKSYLSDLFHILSSSDSSQGNCEPAILKTLFTTPGQALILTDKLGCGDPVDIFGVRE
ncbi:hypothetical protein N431DRAFT_448705 [Stipitochalara longipes BDJ]|nr:hypothetical protein N431DRAFT_448705 [Stipitochalara longipes BDJ]